MSNSLTTTHARIDFSDRFGKSANVKEAVLQFTRLENQLKKSGRVELTHDTLCFLIDQEVRMAVEQVMSDKVTLELSDGELPLLLRAALTEAYLHEKLSQSLATMESLEIAPSEGQYRTIKEPKCMELLQTLQQGISNPRFSAQKESMEELADQIRGLSDVTQLPLEVYQAAFGQNDITSLATMLENAIRGAAQRGIIVPPSQQLQAEHLGGRGTIDMLMHFATREQYTFDRARRAFSHDRMRWVFAGSEEEKPHHVLTYPHGWYAGLASHEQRYVNGIVLKNLADALCIDEARSLFPREVPEAVYVNAMTQKLFGLGGRTGVRNRGDAYELELSPETSLETAAQGMQAVLDAYRSATKRDALIVVNDDSHAASENRRRSGNISIFSLFGGDSNFRNDRESAQPIHAATLWEYLKIEDVEEQKRLFEAFSRLFGDAYRGTTPEESWTCAEIKLTRDGKVTCRFVDDVMYEESTEDEAWDLFEAVDEKKNPEEEERAEYVRQGYFHPNIPRLVEEMRDESASFDVLLAQARSLTGGESTVNVEKSLLWSLNREVSDRILELREQLTLLHDFVTPDQSEWLSALALEKMPTDRDAVFKSYRERVRDLKAHPDHHHGDPVRMESAIADFKRLSRARDELLARVGGPGYGQSVSAYVGRPLDIVSRATEEYIVD